jgi:hypothetical protein
LQFAERLHPHRDCSHQANEPFAVKIQEDIMRKFGLILAAAALVGFAAPAFAIEAGTSVKTRAPMAQADVNAGVKSSSSVRMRHSRGVNKMVQHDRGLHRGFTHSRHLGYAKSRRSGSGTSVTVGSGVRAR